MNTIRLKVIGTLLLLIAGVVSEAQSKWPKEIPFKNGGKVVIYQPQPETFAGNKITGRFAASVKRKSTDEPLFGALFYESTISTNKDTRMADLESIKITNAKFPGIDNQASLDSLITLIETEVPKWKMEISIDALVATIKKDNPDFGSDKFKNDAPKVYYRIKPTTLIILDGDPKVQKDKELDADRIVNSPFLIFKEGSQWNMYTGGIWYKSAAVKEGWTQNKSLSEKVKSIDEQIKKQEKETNGGKAPTTKPEVTDIIVSTEPAELLQTKGEPEYKTVAETSLLYISNSVNEIFKDINSQKFYVLLAGRWYSAALLSGPFEFVPADKLPADFAKIPEGSEKDAVLANVAGTPAAEEAKIDAQIPQTAKVDKKTATVKVEYDGSPKFEPIEGTSLQLAKNSNITVMKDSAGKYFALDNGVWFTSGSANGPWAVANERPKDLQSIPPNSEAYNTKYVYVYESTPEYVYMGYTPGYMGCYVYGPTVVYGTGYYYAPWYGAVYYPRPVTWGFGFHYNPYTGWGMSVGVSYGFMHVSIGFGGYGGGWYGPPMYRPPYYGGGYGGNHYGNNNVRINTGDINIDNGRNNIYKDHKGVSTKDVKQPGTGGANRPSTKNNGQVARPSQQPNNVFADRDGNTFQKDNKGNWNQRDNKSNSWSSPSQSNQARTNDLNQQSQARDRGNTRTNNYQQSRPAPSRSMSGGSRGGGGGGRRR